MAKRVLIGVGNGTTPQEAAAQAADYTNSSLERTKQELISATPQTFMLAPDKWVHIITVVVETNS